MDLTSDVRYVAADLSGLVSLATDTDANDQSAVRAAERLRAESATIIVPSDVFSETMNVLGKHSGHKTALRIAAELARGLFSIVPSEPVIPAALARFAQVPESVSFTDCVVMAIADAFGTDAIFGFDRAFRTAGYQILPLTIG